MGYLSNFEIIPQGVTDDDILDVMCEQLEDITDGYEFVSFLPGMISSGDMYKWYDHQQDLATLSTLHPGVVFEMRIVGEDSEMYQVYAKDGATYGDSIVPTWPEFDESRLPT